MFLWIQKVLMRCVYTAGKACQMQLRFGLESVRLNSVVFKWKKQHLRVTTSYTSPSNANDFTVLHYSIGIYQKYIVKLSIFYCHLFGVLAFVTSNSLWAINKTTNNNLFRPISHGAYIIDLKEILTCETKAPKGDSSLTSTGRPRKWICFTYKRKK